MGFFGLSEILILFAVAGGMADAGNVKLTAPRDTADKAIRYLLPDAEVVVHMNLEAGIGNVFALLDEVAELKFAKSSAEISQAIGAAQTKMAEGLKFLGNEVGLDLASDLGSITFSLSLASKDKMALLIRMRGNFKDGKLESKITKDAVGTYEFAGKTIHRLKEEPVFSDTVLTFPDATTLLLGLRPVVEEVLSKGKVKPSKGGRTARLAKLVNRKTATFALLALPDWAVAELARDESAKLVAKFLGEVDYLYYGAAKGKGVFEAGVSSKEARTRVAYLFKSAAGFLDAVRGIIDAGAYSILGIIPLVPPSEIETAWQEALSDEDAVLEVAAWFKQRFTGKSVVKVNSRKQTVRLELDNPAALCGAVAPVLAGAGYWMYMRPFQGAEPLYEEKIEFEPERQPAIEYIPIPQS